MKHTDALQEPADAIVVECELDEPPEKVWRALTEPEILAEWLMPDALLPKDGLCARPCAGEPEKIECEMLNAEPNRFLQYSWRESTSESAPNRAVVDSVVTFVLTETAAGGTHLRVVHGEFKLREPQTMQTRAQTVCAADNVVNLFSRSRRSVYGPRRCHAGTTRLAA